MPGKKALKPNEVGLEDLEEAGFIIDYKLIKLFGIEKKTKTLKELGASASQIQQNELGKLAASMGLDTPEELRMALDALEEKYKRDTSSKPQQQNSSKQEEKSDIEDKLAKKNEHYKSLYEDKLEGVISQEDFDAAKSKLLGI